METRGELIFLLIGAAVAFGAGIWAFMVRCILSVHRRQSECTQKVSERMTMNLNQHSMAKNPTLY